MPANEIQAVAGRLAESGTPLISLVQDRTYPSKPKDNAALPYVVFYRQSGGDGANLSGQRATRQYEIRVDAYATSQEQADEVLAAVFDRLHCWRDRDAGVQGCFARGDADEQVLGDGNFVSGQTFALTFNPQ